LFDWANFCQSDKIRYRSGDNKRLFFQRLPAAVDMNKKTSRSNKVSKTRGKKDSIEFHNLVDTMPVMIYAAEPFPPYSPMFVSSAFEAFGYPLEKWRESADLWIRALHADDRERVLEETAEALENGGETDLEYRIVAENGDVFWVRDRGCFLRDENGNLICWQGVIIDITDRKEGEKCLRDSEKRYRQLFEKNHAVKLLVDAETGEIVEANPAACRFYGYTLEEFKTKNICEINTLSPAEIALEMKRAINEECNYFTFRHRLASGEIRDVELRSSPLFDNNRKLLYSNVYDITERKQAEKAVRENEARYRDLFENANDLIYIHDLEGNFISVNNVAERVFGYPREDALKMNFKQIIAPEHLKLARQQLSAKIKGIKQATYEVDCLTKDGRRITVEINSRPILKDGKPVAVQGIARDVTERRMAQKQLKEREEQYRDLFENANDLIYTHDLKGNFTSLNRAGETITGYRREEALKMNINQVVAPDYLEAARQMINQKIEGVPPTTYELDIIAKQGNRVSLELSTRLIYQNNQPIGVQGIARDITERKRSEEALINSERQYRLLGEGIKHQVWTATPDGKLDYANARTLEYFGCTLEQILDEGWQTVVHPDDLFDCLRKWKHSLETGKDYEVEFRLKRHDGTFRWHHALATAGLDAEGKIINWFGTNTDINDKKLAEAKLNHFAGHDTLTNLPNRARFMHQLERAATRAQHNSSFCFAVLFLDLDRFKVINDSLGHSIGDKLLIAIARRLESCIRPGDIVARLGGDEFTVLLSNINEPSDAVSVAKRFLEKLSAPFLLDTYEVFTSASIGIIVSDEINRRPEDFLRDADTAMYRAKEAGKARYEIFNREMHIRNMNLLEMENDLRRAIENKEFRVFYQPIVSLETGEIREFEALIRWQHPKHGLVMPNEFIGIAEETGLIIPIGEWILKEACRQTARWRKTMPQFSDLAISVNLSAKQLMHPNLTAQIGKILKETAFNARHLKLEVTESMVMENSDKALAVISSLKNLGISLSTDDFGTGYSSLSYLHRFPFSCIKIDRSFISKMDSDQKSAAIVRTILLLGQNLHLEIVAEGIENERQLEALQQLGCKTGQGYLFAKPVNAEKATRLLRDGFQKSFRQSFFTFNETAEQQLLELDKIQ
jgi:diguanylate cyclase (GGDEF)-like protein/PAS domain S-box-containing protein